MADLPTPISVPHALPPQGHYSMGIRHGGLVYVSGQLGMRADGSHTADLPFEDQVRQAMQNLLAVLGSAGLGPENILKVTAYIVGVANWPAFNVIYAEIMGAARPARSVVPVPELHYGYKVEIEAIAAEPGERGKP
jgi:2-iminobutanoate/2-iminopropanoate deaminase